MTLLHAHGFRYGGAARYNEAAGVQFLSTGGFNNGVDTYCMKLNTSFQQYARKDVPSRDTLIAGFRLWLPTDVTTSSDIFCFSDDTVTTAAHVRFYIDTTTFRITAKRGSTVLDVSDPIASTANEFVYLEFKNKIDDAAGTVEIRSFGVPKLVLSGVDTRNGGTAGITRCYLGRTDSGSTRIGFIYDDFYICDTLGATNNDFLASTTHTPRIIDLNPASAGDMTQWVATGGGGVNWAAASGNTVGDDTSYVASSTVGAKDLYGLTSLPAGVIDIRGLMQWAQWRKDDATIRAAALALRSGGVDSDGASTGLINSYTTGERAVEIDPATGAAWTATGVNALQIGQKVAA